MLAREIIPLPPHLYPPDEWRVVESAVDPAHLDRAETFFSLSNGYLGIRGTFEEGLPALSPGTFVNGFHETWPIEHAEEAYGLARTGQTIVNVPEATVLQLSVDDEPLYLPVARTQGYRRVLDLRAGTLSREFVWSLPSGKHVRVRSCRLVSLEHRHLAAIQFEVTVLDHPAALAVSSRVRDLQDAAPGDGPRSARTDPRLAKQFDHRVLDLRLHEQEGERLLLGYRAANSGMTLGLGVDHVIETRVPHEVARTVGGELSELVLTADAEPGVPVRITKYVTYQSSRRAPPHELTGRCTRTLDRAVRNGFGALVEGQRAELDRFWDRADVQVGCSERDGRTQQAVRWNLFQLAQASWRTDGAGIPAKGLTGQAYEGHYFWDTEVYVLPFLAYTQPRIARNLLRFRHRMLDRARARAGELNQRGALFPWRTINGEEASAYYQAGTAQYHLNADIAYAIRRYVDIRGDTGFMAEAGAEILVETARLWEDLGFYGADGAFHIHSVTGPDEYTTVVNDNTFTNLMARLNLNTAAASLRRMQREAPADHALLCKELGVGRSEVEAWERAAEAMYVPYDPARGIHPQDEAFLDRKVWDLQSTPRDRFPLLLHYHPLVIYRHQVLKQADVVLAMCLLGNEFDREQKRRDFDYYDPLTTGDSSLSACMQSIVAAEIGNEAKALEYFDYALMMDLADLAGNVSDGVHVASTGGVWQALVFGFGGVRDFDGVLRIDPRLPESWDRLAFSVRFHDRQLRVTLTPSVETYLSDEGEPLTVVVRGEPVLLTAGEPLEVAVPPPAAEAAEAGQPSEPGTGAADLSGYDAVVFDLDGVLTDTARVHASAWKRLFDDFLRRRCGPAFAEFTDGDYLAHVDGKPRYDGVESFLGSRGIEVPPGDPADPPGKDTVRGLGNRKDELFHVALQEQGVHRFETSVRLVEELRARGVRTAVVSSSRNCREVVQRAGMAHLFDERVDGVVLDETGLPGKPDPAMFLEAVRRLGVPPDRAAVVEDAVSGVQAGRRGGFGLVVGVDRHEQAQALREHGAGVVVRDLGELLAHLAPRG